MTDAAVKAESPGALDWATDLLASAVARVAATELNPTDPFRGLYISDDSALTAVGELVATPTDHTVERLAARVGLDEPIDVALLALCAAPDLDGRFGRLVGFLPRRHRPPPCQPASAGHAAAATHRSAAASPAGTSRATTPAGIVASSRRR
ncbi:MAG: family ATPase [Solirubrobacterales bacterium]|nr:family ATPase [Solirubrobacterales bacterium]